LDICKKLACKELAGRILDQKKKKMDKAAENAVKLAGYHD
jgi:hypothetical protein